MRLFGSAGQVDRVNWMAMPFSAAFFTVVPPVLSTLCGTLVVQTRLAGVGELDVRLDGALTTSPRLVGVVELEEC